MKLFKILSILSCTCALHSIAADYTFTDCDPPCGSACSPCNKLYVSADYLYWLPTQGGMTYALAVDGIAGAPLAENNKEIQQKSKWGSGFRVGVGIEPGSAPCDVSATWTNFHHVARSSSDAPFVIASQLLGPTNPFIVGGSGVGAGNPRSKWDLNLNIFEIDLGYDLIGNDCYRLRPYVGVVAARIDQTQTISYDNFFDTTFSVFMNATVKQKNNFKGIGPKLGLEGEVAIGSGVGITGNLGASFYYGKAKSPVTTHIENDPLGFLHTDYEVEYKKYRIIPSFQAQLGLTWALVRGENFSVDLAALYEVQCFLGTWRNQTSQIQNLYVADAGYDNLMLNGFTGHLKISF